MCINIRQLNGGKNILQSPTNLYAVNTPLSAVNLFKLQQEYAESFDLRRWFNKAPFHV